MFFHMVYKSGQIFLPFCHNSRVWQTNRRTDRSLIARPRLHSMQRGKNETLRRFGSFHSLILEFFGAFSDKIVSPSPERNDVHVYVTPRQLYKYKERSFFSAYTRYLSRHHQLSVRRKSLMENPTRGTLSWRHGGLASRAVAGAGRWQCCACQFVDEDRDVPVAARLVARTHLTHRTHQLTPLRCSFYSHTTQSQTLSLPIS